MHARVRSLRGLAAVLGVSETAVRKAEALGVFGDSIQRCGPKSIPEVINMQSALDAWQSSGRRIRHAADSGAVRLTLTCGGRGIPCWMTPEDAAQLARDVQAAALCFSKRKGEGVTDV